MNHQHTTRTLHQTSGEHAVDLTYGCVCPYDPAHALSVRMLAGGSLRVVTQCQHFHRVWRVTQGERVRAEFRQRRQD